MKVILDDFKYVTKDGKEYIFDTFECNIPELDVIKDEDEITKHITNRIEEFLSNKESE